MNAVTIASNVMEPDTWVRSEVDDVRAFLISQFPEWPSSARIYHNEVAAVCDVTPYDAASVEHLGTLEGEFFVVVYPEGPLLVVLAVVSIVLSIASVALMFLYKPPTATQRNTQATSPNNGLADRSNSPRPLSRIPDIYGQVRSTPDLLAVPYKVFNNHQEYEVAYMCVGRGAFQVTDVRDDTTPISQIPGASVEIYAPGASPNSGDSPQLAIGAAIDRAVVSAKRANSVNGQTLKPPEGAAYFSVNCQFNFPDKLIAEDYTYNYYWNGYDYYDYSQPTNLTQYFSPGDTLSLSVQSFTEEGQTISLSGSYVIDTVSATEITFVDPAATNSDWAKLDLLADDTSDNYFVSMSASGNAWVGPFVLDLSGMTEVYANFIALNGMYKDDGKNQYYAEVQVELELTPVNSAGAAIGSPESFFGTVVGSATETSTRAVTIYATPTFTGRCRVRARRVTAKDTAFNGDVVDEVKWRDVYAVAPVSQLHFGDVTTVMSVTRATDGALAVKDRKLNMLVTRKLPYRTGTSSFSTSLVPTKWLPDILSAVCLDPYIGNRVIAELDLDNFYDTGDEIDSYFGTTVASQFSYTFDSGNLSFEEIVSVIANSVGCVAYRQGNVIKLFFEKETDNSVLLFNHRNKIPGTEVRTIRFGTLDDNDGVEYTYVDPIDDAVVTLYLPSDRSAKKPKRIESVGIRNRLQAYFMAWRAWQKIRFQNTATEFEATQEAEILVQNNRILCADNTRPDTIDGYVVSQNLLELTLSQPVEITGTLDHVIFLQHSDGSVEAIDIVSINSSDHHKITIATAPSLPLSLDEDNYAQATYLVDQSLSVRKQAFIVSERTPNSNYTSSVKAINYDSRYYGHDKDYVNGIVDVNGYEI